jgi:hypothetical protein
MLSVCGASTAPAAVVFRESNLALGGGASRCTLMTMQGAQGIAAKQTLRGNPSFFMVANSFGLPAHLTPGVERVFSQKNARGDPDRCDGSCLLETDWWRKCSTDERVFT